MEAAVAAEAGEAGVVLAVDFDDNFVAVVAVVVVVALPSPFRVASPFDVVP